MKIKVVGTGSSGNCYILEHDGRYLILDAGIKPEKVLAMINYDTDKIDACLITHVHQDHIKYAGYFLNACIPLMMSNITSDLAKFSENNYFINTDKKLTQFGQWKVLPFEVEHDAPGTWGFLISVGEAIICYITDTGYVKVSPTEVTGLIIECNYIDDFLDKALLSSQQLRLKKYHMSLDRTKSFISKMDRTKLQNILLVHVSARHGNNTIMVDEVSKIVNKTINVEMAKAGKELTWQS